MGQFTQDKEALRKLILQGLRQQGFTIRTNRICVPQKLTKEECRQFHRVAVEKKLTLAKPKLQRRESSLIQYIANGIEVRPEKISPELIYVQRDSQEEQLFRYVSLHWSIPVSSGYGRRLRFIIIDRSNNKLIGIIGLGDPVFSMRDRDGWIGWDAQIKGERLYHVMDAFVLGAVPPYSRLLCGKLVAMLATSNVVHEAFIRRYGGRASRIRGVVRPARLVLLTTTSALGRSSVYNRLCYNGTTYWRSIGFTQGYGEFHFSDGVYAAMRDFVVHSDDDKLQPTAKQEKWGTGFRNRREVVRKCLSAVGLSSEMNKHGIRREIFAAPLGAKACEYLRGEVACPKLYDRPVTDLWEIFRDRWLLPRAERNQSYRDFDRRTYKLWDDEVY